MLILKAAALAVVTCVITLILKKEQPAYAFLASACGAVCLLVVAADRLAPFLDWIHTLSDYGITGSAANFCCSWCDRDNLRFDSSYRSRCCSKSFQSKYC